jgi:hypothetical protein
MNNTAVKAAQEAVQRSEELDIRLGLFLVLYTGSGFRQLAKISV